MKTDVEIAKIALPVAIKELSALKDWNAESLHELLMDLGDKVELGGTFCMGQCQKGVCVTVDDALVRESCINR